MLLGIMRKPLAVSERVSSPKLAAAVAAAADDDDHLCIFHRAHGL
jgi:hypothetical protein